MTLPGVTLNVLNGQLGRVPNTNANLMVMIGCSAAGGVDALTYHGSIAGVEDELQYGELLEAAVYEMSVSGGPVGVISLEPTTRGGLSAVVHHGSGAGSMTVSAAPPESIAIACTTGGALGTAAFTFRIGTGAISQAITSAAGWSSTGYRVPGTYTTLTFVSGTYTTSDTYLVSTLGAVTHTAGAGPAVPTQVSSPVDWFTPVITITTGGALGTAQFTYSLDGTTSNTSAAVTTTGGGTYALPGTGIVLTFSGTQTEDDSFSFSSAGPRASNTELAATLTALETTYLPAASYSMLAVVGNLVDASAWGTQCSTLQTAGNTLFDSGVFIRSFNGAPTVGTITADGSGGVTVNSGSTDAALATARASVEADRVAACAGDMLITSPISGLSQRRNGLWAASSMAASVPRSQSIGAVENGAIQGCTYLYRDETVTPSLDAIGFITFRTFPGSVATGTGVPGFYITNGFTMDTVVSDFHLLANARVIDLACQVAKGAALPFTNAKIPTTTRNGQSGVITEKKAQQIEAEVDGKLNTSMVDTSPQEAVGVSVVVDRTHDVLADSTVILTVGAQPFGYAEFIYINIGLVRQA